MSHACAGRRPVLSIIHPSRAIALPVFFSGTAPAPLLGLRIGPCGEFVEAGAAMLFDEGQCFVEHIELGCAAHCPALTRLRHQSGRDEASQMEGEGGRAGVPSRD
jgi:hypothetical protein